MKPVMEHELEAEAAGMTSLEYEKQASQNQVKVPSEEQEAKELAKIMMSKRDKHLYNQIQFGKKKKAEAVQRLKHKKMQKKTHS